VPYGHSYFYHIPYTYSIIVICYRKMAKAYYFGLYLLFLGSCTSSYSEWENKWQILCPALYPRIFTSYVPSGNLTGGIFTKQPLLSTTKHCVVTCCGQQMCHVALMYNMTCYHVQCTSSKLCLPLYRPELLNTNPPRMVLVKPVDDDETWSELLEQENDMSG
jgi:hypothetical protein